MLLASLVFLAPQPASEYLRSVVSRALRADDVVNVNDVIAVRRLNEQLQAPHALGALLEPSGGNLFVLRRERTGQPVVCVSVLWAPYTTPSGKIEAFRELTTWYRHAVGGTLEHDLPERETDMWLLAEM